jgi:DNA-binding XRE family transcriptional regulator
MAKSFKNLRAKMSPAAKEQSKEIARELRREIRLNELRGALDISQEELAKLPGKKQA